jgi:hypothetical protein
MIESGELAHGESYLQLEDSMDQIKTQTDR